jgi:SAM-dependent methyltransferase
MTVISTGFGDVDESGAAAELVAYLRYVNDLPWVRASKARSLEALELAPGMRVLDAGSGVGLDACAFAERVGPGGRVIGVDASREMIALAEQLRPPGLPQLEFRHGDAAALDLPDGSFDAVHSERLLQVHPAPRTVVAELVRVLGPGGRIVMVEPDWGTLALYPGDTDLVRRLADECAAGFPDGWTGRKLGAYLRGAGLEAVRVEARVAVLTDMDTVMRAMNLGPFLDAGVEAGRIDADERAALLESLRSADTAGTLLFAMTTFRAVGRRPRDGSCADTLF